MLMNEVEFSKKLARYLSSLPPNGKFGFYNCGSNSLIVLDVKKINKRAIGNQVYSFLLAGCDGKVEKRSAFVLKTYDRSLDPILRRYRIAENIERCVKEFQVLTSLKSVGFPVPNTCLCELDVNVFSLPFIVMEREVLSNNRLNDFDEFANTLVRLHGLDVETLGISVLKTPENEYEFARRCLRYLKLYLNLYPSRNKELMKDFKLVISWLENNIHMSSCPKYSLLHGDYRANFNTVMTKSSKMVVIDWEDAEIGDPAYDVAMTYTRMRADNGEKAADQPAIIVKFGRFAQVGNLRASRLQWPRRW